MHSKQGILHYYNGRGSGNQGGQVLVIDGSTDQRKKAMPVYVK